MKAKIGPNKLLCVILMSYVITAQNDAPKF